MQSIQSTLVQMIQESKSSFTTDEDDYTVDELIYCGKCKTPRQGIYEGIGKVPILCRCREDERTKQENSQKREKLAARIEDPSLIRYTFADDDKRYELSAAYEYAENWVFNKANNIGLMFMGKIGVGKSFALSCIANTFLDKLIYVEIFSMKELTDIFASYHTNDMTKSKYLNKLRHAEVVMIDEFQLARTSEYFVDNCRDIIEIRYRAQKPLIITTNLSPAEMRSEKDQNKARIYDRIIAMCVPVVIEGESRRREIANHKAEMIHYKE